MNRRPKADSSPVAGLQGKAFERFSDLVDDIYRAALEPDHWPQTVLKVAQLHEAPRALLLTPATAPRDGGFMFAHGLSAAHMELWANKYVHHDPWVKVANEQDVYHDGNVFLSEDLLSREELEKTLFYREYLTQVDMGGFCTGIVFNGAKPGFVDTSCSFFAP